MESKEKEIKEKIIAYEKEHLHEVCQDERRLHFHLMSPVGWLNDPNGLCQFNGMYHVFFQYSPFDVQGGMKVWGHYSSRDLLKWKYDGVPLVPDMPFDKDGVYSGSAMVENDQVHLFYTGNVKNEGNYDYVYEGREGNTIRVSSQDGYIFGTKKLVLRNGDYPSYYSCHIRDPKIWREYDTFYMVLGGRTREDVGAVLFYESKDLEHWQFRKDITTKDVFGYMWECPDYILLEGSEFLSCSPQGVASDEYRYQNIYQSGYFKVEGKLLTQGELTDFTEWDMGFDFYAPQTFVDEVGRTILIGWAGIPDATYTNPTIDVGWQHALTMPRVLTLKNGKIYQNPVEEMKSLRENRITLTSGECMNFTMDCFEAIITDIKNHSCEITIAKGVHLSYEEEVFTLSFTGNCGSGRTIRKAKINNLNEIRILVDSSLLEIYLNGGEVVFTTRYYKDFAGNSFYAECENSNIIVWELRSMEVIFGE